MGIIASPNCSTLYMANHQHCEEPVETRIRHFAVLLKHLYLNNQRGSVIPLSLIPVTTITSGLAVGLGVPDLIHFATTVGDWLKHVSHTDLMNTFLVWMFDIVSKVLWTPAFLFDNDWFREMVKKFSLISMSFVTALTMFEGIKRILNIAHTSMRKILLRFPIALGVCAFAPLGFVKAVTLLNKATRFVIDSSVAILHENTVSHVGDLGVFLDQFSMILFIVLYVMMMIPMFLQIGRRWFDMLTLGILTPLAMLGFIFDSLNKFYKKWWNALKSLFIVQLAYAVFVSILSAIMFTLPFPPDFGGGLAKAIILLGGLYRLAFPPAFVKHMLDKGVDGKDALKQLGKQLAKVTIFKGLK